MNAGKRFPGGRFLHVAASGETVYRQLQEKLGMAIMAHYACAAWITPRHVIEIAPGQGDFTVLSVRRRANRTI